MLGGSLAQRPAEGADAVPHCGLDLFRAIRCRVGFIDSENQVHAADDQLALALAQGRVGGGVAIKRSGATCYTFLLPDQLQRNLLPACARR